MPRTPLSRRPRTELLAGDFRLLCGAHLVTNLGDGISLVAYPWLASALTRNPILISGVLVAQRLPWLLFSLPIGVVVDRRDRRNLMIGADVVRALLTVIVGVTILSRQSGLPAPDDVQSLAAGGESFESRVGLYAMLLTATFLLGIGEVVRDTSTLTLVPQIVPEPRLERANGLLASIEQGANQFVGPMVAAVLLAGGFALPVFVDAGTFAVSAVILSLIVTGPVTHPGPKGPKQGSAPSAMSRFRSELAVGYRAVRGHEYLRLLAVVAAVVNLTAGMIFAIIIFYAQEILGTLPFEFSVLTIGSAAGSVLGGMTAAGLAERLGSGATMRVSLVAMSLSLVAIGLVDSWLVVAVLLGLYGFCLVIWAVLTLSLRQAITPGHILGRVNGVYRFFSFGAIPVGAVLGGLMVAGIEVVQGRELALRFPFLLAGVAQAILFLAVARRLANERIDAVRLTGLDELHAAAGPDAEPDNGDGEGEGEGAPVS